MPVPIPTAAHRRYALVVDAGSSGSRLQVYSWRDARVEREQLAGGSSRWGSSEGDKGQGKGKGSLRRLPRVEKGVKEGAGEWQKKVEPGISSLALDPITRDSVSSYLSPLLTHALQSIPPSQHAQTPIYILATAGMRLLPSEQSDAIIQTTCDVLRQDYPFRVGESSKDGPCGENVRIVSGEEEGLWGWVAVNYLMDGFGDPEALVPRASSSSMYANGGGSPLSDGNEAASTYGFLDMGGASTQIAFSPSPDEAAQHKSSLSPVKLRLLSGEDLDYDVFVASWLGYGTNKARERYVGLKVEEWEAGLRQEASSSSIEPPIPDPCLPKSLVLSEKPKIPHSHLASTSSADAHHATSTHSLIGTGSFPQCLKSLQPLLNKHLPCPLNADPSSSLPSSCLFGGLPTPKIDFNQHRFIGVSEYWYSSEHVFGMGGAWDFLEFERKASEFCSREWSSIESGYEREWKGEDALPNTGDGEVLDKDGKIVEVGKWGPEVEIPRLQMQCFKAAWLVNVLHEGIGLPRIIDRGGGKLLPPSSHSSSSPPTNPSLPYNSSSPTELEALSQAAQKNLGPSFQSVDTVGDTAISWTLGKMVIEASRDVPPLPAGSTGGRFGGGWAAAFPERFSLGGAMSGGAGFAAGPGGYAASLFLLVGLVIFIVLRLSRPSFARATSPRRLAQRWKRDLEDSEEEAFIGSLRSRSSPSFPKGGLFGILSSFKRLILSPIRHSSGGRPRTLKHTHSSPAVLASSPTRNFFFSSSSTPQLFPQSAFSSTPPIPSSPRKKPPRQFNNASSIDADSDEYDNILHFPSSTPSSISSNLPVTSSSLAASFGPPRASRRPSPSSVQGSVDFHLLPLRDILGRTLPSSSTPSSSSSAASSHQAAYSGPGWNDIPEAVLNGSSYRSKPRDAASHRALTTDEEECPSVPTAPASANSLVSSARNSRNSSRVDLTLSSSLTGRGGGRTGSGVWDD